MSSSQNCSRHDCPASYTFQRYCFLGADVSIASARDRNELSASVLSLKLSQQIQGEEKQRNRRKLTEGTEWDLDRETGVPSQLTVEAVVNQFRQLLENDGKRTEGYLYFRSFSVVFAN